jgi:flagellar basal-body rod protein FlgB
MRMNHFLQNRFMDETTRILSKVLDFRSAKQQVISENIANVDTPGFSPKDLKFDQELQRALEKTDLSLNTTNSAHFSGPVPADGHRYPVEILASPENGTGEFNIDAEMAKMMTNNLLYEATTKLISKKLNGLKTAIEGLRR